MSIWDSQSGGIRKDNLAVMISRAALARRGDLKVRVYFAMLRIARKIIFVEV